MANENEKSGSAIDHEKLMQQQRMRIWIHRFEEDFTHEQLVRMIVETWIDGGLDDYQLQWIHSQWVIMAALNEEHDPCYLCKGSGLVPSQLKIKGLQLQIDCPSCGGSGRK